MKIQASDYINLSGDFEKAGFELIRKMDGDGKTSLEIAQELGISQRAAVLASTTASYSEYATLRRMERERAKLDDCLMVAKATAKKQRELKPWEWVIGVTILIVIVAVIVWVLASVFNIIGGFAQCH